ncbi:H-type small acid-soluble spore protein [Oceanobacillus piezotolerans]|uniref:Small, acid-soluble spore protein H n=1 Tax=Oceanobacillus piezotolerans TaxID=2448030 RepID=A0A498D847_9BACI|nr:H-type small acid-soluble spore protein [Oceanobacillus piezotolerans]RLL42713.1 H-type small acid-soluble spore protein [Oceanobacillus piezotolerans]
MDSKRAQQIIDSTTMINVNYHGIPVYIKDIKETEGTATVFPLDNMEHDQLVDLEGLNEVVIKPTNHN